MDIPADAWTTINSLGVAGLAALSAVTIAKLNRNNRTTEGVSGQVEDAKEVAAEARDNAAPVANGFTRHTSEALGRIESVIGRISERTGTIEASLLAHLGDHVHGGAVIVPRQQGDMSPRTEPPLD